MSKFLNQILPALLKNPASSSGTGKPEVRFLPGFLAAVGDVSTPTVFPLLVEARDRDGDTRAFASATISRQPDKGFVLLRVGVNKSGGIITGGTGFASASLSILDAVN